MKIPVRQLDRHLRDKLARAYLIAGDEPLLVDEAAEAVRTAARGQGFDSRELHVVDRGLRWAELSSGADNLSLFASRKIVELRMATPRPGDAGSRTIAELCENDDPARLLLVVVGEKLDSSAARAAWAKAIEEHGVVVEIWPIERGELPRWVEERARASGLKLTHAAAQLLAERVEGNLLAADQEIKRLAIVAAGREIDEAEVLESVANHSRFDVFRLTDAVLAGDAPRAIKVLSALKGEGVAPTLVSWALSREIVLLARLQYAARPRREPGCGDAAYGRLAAPPAAREAGHRRVTGVTISGLLVSQSAAVDGMIKGVTEATPWEALTGLLIALLQPVARH